MVMSKEERFHSNAHLLGSIIGPDVYEIDPRNFEFALGELQAALEQDPNLIDVPDSKGRTPLRLYLEAMLKMGPTPEESAKQFLRRGLQFFIKNGANLNAEIIVERDGQKYIKPMLEYHYQPALNAVLREFLFDERNQSFIDYEAQQEVMFQSWRRGEIEKLTSPPRPEFLWNGGENAVNVGTAVAADTGGVTTPAPAPLVSAGAPAPTAAAPSPAAASPAPQVSGRTLDTRAVERLEQPTKDKGAT